MSNNVLPNLSEWFEVPVGATIPAGTRYVRSYSDGFIHVYRDDDPLPVEVESTYFTGQPIEAPKKTLEDVIRDAGTSITDIARAVEAFYAEQKSKQPRVIIDNAGEEEWRLNAEGTYDLCDLNGDRSISFVGYTREHIEHVHGIKEERY